VERMLHFVAEDPELVRFMVAEHGGAFASFRTALRAQLTRLAQALQAAVAPGAPAHAAEACVVLLLDAAERALDAEANARQVIAEQLAQTMRRLLTDQAEPRGHG
jgi:hypothetical protein